MATVSDRIPIRAGRLHQADVAAQSVVRNTEDNKAIKRPRNTRVWAIFITAALGTLAFLILWTSVVIPWWRGVQDQWQYGSACITHFDADVGHGGESHFIAEFYKGAIVVIEIPFANTNNTRSYVVAGLSSNGTTPVILLSTTKDDQTGRLDLIVRVAGTDFAITLYNTGSAFSKEKQ
jgi:hypothetical protein